MIDHVGFNVSDIDASKRFYEAALRPLGYSAALEFKEHVGFGTGEGSPDFWISLRGEPTATAHLAFVAPDRATVDAFYEAAIAAGGTDNGPPGLRPHYHEHYYGAYVTDPDGNNVEAVAHAPER
jgi:catechol 2,3-dioxygenase-like lactoylglutathione lyase family enzyme